MDRQSQSKCKAWRDAANELRARNEDNCDLELRTHL